MRYLVTGSAGFIGFHVSSALLELGHEVVGIDILNDYYSTELKLARNAVLLAHKNYAFIQNDICEIGNLALELGSEPFDGILHFAAQAGVRYSIDQPAQYVHANLQGFFAMLEYARGSKPRKFLYASSSSVYGANAKIPFSTEDTIGRPISFYGATKVANEAMAYSYHHLYGVQMVGLRFFTVYGPWGRPDMAYFKFAEAIASGTPIDVYSGGQMQRSFTYIDDVVRSVLGCLQLEDKYAVLNIGNDTSVPLMHFIQCLESSLGKKAVINFLPPQPGDMQATAAEISITTEKLGFRPSVPIEEGIARFIMWYRDYKGANT